MEERNIFKHDFKNYKTFLNPIEDYLDQNSLFFSRKYNIPIEKARELIKECVKEHGLKNPNITIKEKNPYGDMEITKTKLLNYIMNVKKEKNIIVPSFTVYLHPSIQKSIHSELLFENVAMRKQDKKLAFKYEREEDHEKAAFYNTNQKTRKVENNSLSGGYASSSTILYNPSAHFTLTSITRCVSGIGNALSESLVAGNKFFKEPRSVVNYIVTASTKINYDLVKEVVDKYKLTIPTPQEVFNYMKESWKMYWKNQHMENYILHLLGSLDKYCLAGVLYVNDLWSLKTYNEKLVRALINKLSFKVEGKKVDDPLKSLDGTLEGINELVHHIYAEEIKGKDIDYKKLLEDNDPLIYGLSATAQNIRDTLMKISDLIHAFYVTDILPINVAYIKDMFRKVIVLSDTDSTCCSYDKWVEWYFGRPLVDNKSLGVSATIMTIVTQVMDHNLRMLAKNMNTGEMGDNDNFLSMKNEFCWPVFVTANVTKHYFASTMIQEGNVFKENKLEKKGVHYISSTVGGDIVKETERVMWKIMDSVSENKDVSLVDLCSEVANFERRILKDFEERKCYMFRKDSIKPAKSYKQKPEESKYLNHMLWEEVFSSQYGQAGEPPYTIYTLPLKVDNVTDWVALVEHVKSKNPEMAQKLVMFVNKYKKDGKISTLRIPKLIADGQGIPGEFKEFVDVKTSIMQSLRPLYYVLETVGYFKKPEYMLSELNF